MRFELYRDAKREWRWRLKAGNHRIIASSAGDGYKHWQDALAMIHRVCALPKRGIPIKVIDA